jgi:energy-converting hydrogenase Eha subunit F
VWLSAVSSKYFVILEETSSFILVIVLEYSRNLDLVLLSSLLMFSFCLSKVLTDFYRSFISSFTSFWRIELRSLS